MVMAVGTVSCKLCVPNNLRSGFHMPQKACSTKRTASSPTSITSESAPSLLCKPIANASTFSTLMLHNSWKMRELSASGLKGMQRRWHADLTPDDMNVNGMRLGMSLITCCMCVCVCVCVCVLVCVRGHMTERKLCLCIDLMHLWLLLQDLCLKVMIVFVKCGACRCDP